MRRRLRRLADRAELARYLKVCTKTVDRRVRSGHLPQAFYPSPGCPRWDLDEIDAALEASRKPRPPASPEAMAA